MADVFISYFKPERALTEALAEDLEAAGYSVWWDTALLGDDMFRPVIDREIDQCTRAIIIWTPQSIVRPWVLSEADHAMRLGKLINTVAMGQAPNLLPKPFGQINAIALEDRNKIIATVKRASTQHAEKSDTPPDWLFVPRQSTKMAYPIAATTAVLTAAGRLIELTDLKDWEDDLRHYADVLLTSAEDVIESMTLFTAESSFTTIEEFNDRVWLKQVQRTMDESKKTIEKEMRWLKGKLTRAVMQEARNDLHYAGVELRDACQRK